MVTRTSLIDLEHVAHCIDSDVASRVTVGTYPGISRLVSLGFVAQYASPIYGRNTYIVTEAGHAALELLWDFGAEYAAEMLQVGDLALYCADFQVSLRS